MVNFLVLIEDKLADHGKNWLRDNAESIKEGY